MWKLVMEIRGSVLLNVFLSTGTVAIWPGMSSTSIMPVTGTETLVRPVAANDPHYAELAVGRAVTVQGHITGANIGSPSASLGQCSLVAP